MTGATPAITVLFAMLLLREKTNVTRILGVLCTVFGILLIQGLFLPGSRFTYEHLQGNLLVLCAAACESLFNVLSRAAAALRVNKQQNIHPAVQTVLVSAMAWTISFIPSLSEHPLASLAGIGWLGWLALVWYGYGCDRACVCLLVCGNPALQRIDGRRFFGHDAVYGLDIIRLAAERRDRLASMDGRIAGHSRNSPDRQHAYRFASGEGAAVHNVAQG